jgi:hypothetical protein
VKQLKRPKDLLTLLFQTALLLLINVSDLYQRLMIKKWVDLVVFQSFLNQVWLLIAFG